jgi:hypothetical protein
MGFLLFIFVSLVAPFFIGVAMARPTKSMPFGLGLTLALITTPEEA